MSSPVVMREMGELPVSIGTSFSLQGLYNTHPDKTPEKILPASKGEVLYINLRTMLRNVFNATESDKVIHVKAKDYVNALKDEIQDISSFMENQEHPLKLFFYLPTYASLHKEFGNTADLREPSTDLQKAKLEVEKSVFALIEKEINLLEEERRYINIIDMEIKAPERQRAFILSHLPIDLLYAKGFSNVLLLESHTGKVKSENEWYTKFSAEARERIPFNKATLTFFGDSGGMFKPQHHKARKALTAVADKYKWTYQTTKEKILLNLRLGGQGVIEQVMKEMFR